METNKELEIWHKQFNLDEKDNLDTLPTEKAVYGVFGIVDDKSINCRYVGETDNLKDAVKELFETPEDEGLKKFMQGPWIQMLKYELLPESSEKDRQESMQEWTEKYKPNVDEEGEYPGYYNY
ncbi:hypothetical protein [Dokdonia sp.]|uniref:hypothetical protein n=1 Tax=Dokdonia sp. TaxID=2024995 RepID=UPI003265AB5B